MTFDPRLTQPKIWNAHQASDIRGTLIRAFESDVLRSFERENRLDFGHCVADVNYVISNQYVLRGMHWQRGSNACAKLLTCVAGEIQDVIVDLRVYSHSYLKYASYLLSGDKPQHLFVPKGFAHGFLTLSTTSTVVYAIGYPGYWKPDERNLVFDDPDINISWNVDNELIILSDKDKQAPTLKQLDDKALIFN